MNAVQNSGRFSGAVPELMCRRRRGSRGLLLPPQRTKIIRWGPRRGKRPWVSVASGYSNSGTAAGRDGRRQMHFATRKVQWASRRLSGVDWRMKMRTSARGKVRIRPRAARRHAEPGFRPCEFVPWLSREHSHPRRKNKDAPRVGHPGPGTSSRGQRSSGLCRRPIECGGRREW